MISNKEQFLYLEYKEWYFKILSSPDPNPKLLSMVQDYYEDYMERVAEQCKNTPEPFCPKFNGL